MDVLDLMTEQDEKIERLLLSVADKDPEVAALVRALNQKLERVMGLLAAESRTIERLARRVREVNLSACGIGFLSETDIPVGARLALELELSADKLPIQTHGMVVAVEPHQQGFYWRIDFYGMAPEPQERLIQHIVQRQSTQLNGMRQS